MKRILSFVVLFALAALPGTAQSPPADVVKATLLPGWRTADGTQMAGLHLRLAPGWKTYWRLPGESGIPPEFGWQGSENLRSARIHWPHPAVFNDYGVQTIGYKDEVILPIELVADDGDAALTLRGQGFIGVCKDVCLPMEISFAALLPATGAEGKDAGAIRAALGKAPTAPPLRDAASCRVTPIADGLRVTAEIAIGAQGGEEHVFMDPGRADIWVSPADVSRTGGMLRATADLVPPDARPFAFDRSGLRMTVLGTNGSVDIAGCRAG